MAQATELNDRITKCNKILDENPNSQIFAALAEAYRKKGDVDKAFRVCQSGLKVHPDYGSAHLVMAKISFDKGLYDWAEMEVNKIIELNGNSHATDMLLAEIYIHKGESAKAAKILNKLQSVDANNPQVMRLLDLVKKLPLKSPEKPAITANIVEESIPPEKPETPKPAEKISIKQLLDSISEVAGIEGALLINREGLVAEARWEDAQPPELYGAIAKDIERTIQSQIEISHFGKYENILVEADDLVIDFLPLKDNLLLIKANRQINLGTLRLKLSQLLSKLDEDFG